MCTTNLSSKIIYTLTDESPLLSTYSLLPIIFTFIKDTGIIIEIKDISLATRILSKCSQYLRFEEQKSNDLYDLSQVIKIKDANIIKLPNISASLPQLKQAIQELKNSGYCIPNYIDKPKNICEENIKLLYDNIKGSAVNPVLRDGNSIRYVPSVIKKYLKRNFRADNWSMASKSHVSHMNSGDFYGNEESIIVNHSRYITIILLNRLGTKKILKEKILVSVGDVIDVSYMKKQLLIHFIREQIQDAKNQQILLSIHLKSTMMKISDPIIFGVIVSEFYSNIYKKYKQYFEALNINFNNGISDLYNNMEQLPKIVQEDIKRSLELIYVQQPKLAMVDYNNGITNLHVPHGMIIDSSMANMIYNSGKMLGDDGKLYDTKAIIPDRCYAYMYQAVIKNCKKYGAFNSNTMGSMMNIGLMAQKAEEYGSCDTTFEIPYDGIVQVIDNNNQLLFENVVQVGDIWRLCQTSDIAIKHWIKLACEYAETRNIPTVFWLDDKRQHDICLIKKVRSYAKILSFANITILPPVQAVVFSIERIRSGKNVISVTGNVLRDYLTDLFPILELGSSSRTLSITRLISNGILCETGSGGSAPKHFETFIKNNHLSWDSLGEFFALFASLRHIFDNYGNFKAKILSDSLYQGICKLIKMGQLPSKNIGELDSRGSHFYLAIYWSEALALQNADKMLKNKFKSLCDMLTVNKKNIADELIQVQGKSVELGGYYNPNVEKLKQIMRPSIIFNDILKLF